MQNEHDIMFQIKLLTSEIDPLFQVNAYYLKEWCPKFILPRLPTAHVFPCLHGRYTVKN